MLLNGNPGRGVLNKCLFHGVDLFCGYYIRVMEKDEKLENREVWVEQTTAAILKSLRGVSLILTHTHNTHTVPSALILNSYLSSIVTILQFEVFLARWFVTYFFFLGCYYFLRPC